MSTSDLTADELQKLELIWEKLLCTIMHSVANLETIGL